MKDKIKTISLADEIDAKLSKRTQKILLYVIGLVLIFVVYMLVYSPMQLKNEDLKLRISTLTREEQALEAMQTKIDENRQAIQDMEKDRDKILKNYPNMIKQEELVVEFITLEEKTGMQITDINFSPRNLVSSGATSTSDAETSGTTTSSTTTEQTTAEDAANQTQSASDAIADEADAASAGTESPTESPTEAPTASSDYQLFVNTVDCTFEISYEGLKELFTALQKTDLIRKNIENVSVNYDTETGVLRGNMIINFYSLQGEDLDNKVNIVIPDTNKGTSNIFHSVE